MPTAQQLIDAGYTGYQGWGDAEANADFNATNGAGKGGPVSVTGNTFNFDYEAAAKQAYGDLGAYYDRIIKESQGDLNKAMARMVEDYDRGLRIKKEDTATTKTAIDTSQANTMQSAEANANARGLLSKSAYANPNDPNQYGVYDQTVNRLMVPFNRARTAADLGLSRFQEGADITKSRQQTDLPLAEQRKEFSLEQQRRTEAASMANTKGSRAYQDYLNKFNGV